MVDNLTKEQRSYCMSKIKSKWTKQEIKVHNFLKGNKIKHQMHPKIIGCPDILLTKDKITIYLHGCFWHKCPRCFKKPKTRMTYWTQKINNNVRRDRRNEKYLKREGYKLLKLWEHDINKNIHMCITKIKLSR